MTDNTYDISFFFAIGLFIDPNFPTITELDTYVEVVMRIFPNISFDKMITNDEPPKIMYDDYIRGLYSTAFNKTFKEKIQREIFDIGTPSYARATTFCTLDVLTYIINRFNARHIISGSEQERIIFFTRANRILKLMADARKSKKVQAKYDSLVEAFNLLRSPTSTPSAPQDALNVGDPNGVKALKSYTSASTNDPSELCFSVKKLVRGLLLGEPRGMTSRELLKYVPSQYKGLASQNTGLFFALIWQEIIKQSNDNENPYKNIDLKPLIPKTTDISQLPSTIISNISEVQKNLCAQEWKNKIIPSQTDLEMFEMGVAMTVACGA